MSIIVILICVSVLVASLFLWAFIWSVRSGQYDDDYTPSVRMLFDDQKPESTTETTTKTTT
ncbi:MAG: cbb3-type cytochrome oxidase assembly protein CcoS [Bacteroidia bacterium]